MRRVIASLGEVLFYVATSNDEAATGEEDGGVGGDDDAWRMPSWAPDVLRGFIVRQGQGCDTTVCHYAARTVENIVAKSDVCAPSLCTREMGGALFGLLCAADSSDGLRVTAARALSNVLRRAPALRGHVLARTDDAVRAVVGGLRDGSLALQQPLLNILNACLSDGGGGGAADAGAAAARPVRHALLEAATGALVPTLTRIAERGGAGALAEKALLSLALLLRCDDIVSSVAQPLSLHLAGDRHTVAFVDRLLGRRPPTSPPSRMVSALRLFIEDAVHVVLDAVAAALGSQAPVTVHVQQPSAAAAAGRSGSPTAAPYVPALGAARALRGLLSSPHFAALLASESLVAEAAEFFGLAPALVPSPSLPAMHAESTQLLDALIARPELLLAPFGALPCTLLLPLLGRELDVGAGGRRQDAGRLLADLLHEVLRFPGLRPPARREAWDDGGAAGAVVAAVDAEVIRRLPSLLNDADPVVPVVAMRALRAIAEWHPALVPTEVVVSLVRRLPLGGGGAHVPYEARHMNVVDLLSVCLGRDIVSGGALVEWGMVPRLGCLLHAAAATREGGGGPRNVDCFLPLLCLMSALLLRVREPGVGEAPRGSIAPPLVAAWGPSLDDLMALLADIEPSGGGQDSALEVCKTLRLLFDKCGGAVVGHAVGANAPSVMWSVCTHTPARIARPACA